MGLAYRFLDFHYPSSNVPGGPANQCAIRLSLALESACPALYQHLLRVREDQQPLFHGRYFRKAQELAALLRVYWKFDQCFDTPPRVFTPNGRSQSRQTRAAIRSLDQPGIIFFKDCFDRRPRPIASAATQTDTAAGTGSTVGNSSVPDAQNQHAGGPGVASRMRPGRAEDHERRDGNGDHIDIISNAPPSPVTRNHHRRHRVRHTYIWDGRADEIWFWPMPE